MRETVRVLPDLRTEGGRETLERAITVAASVVEPDPVRRASRVRALLPPELATEALAQAELRSRAADKFGGRAARLYFTPDGLEQATRWEVAEHRARRFAAAGVPAVLDLCCGIGADVLAFADAGLAVTGIDSDAATVAIAAANVARSGLSARIEVGEAEACPWRDAAAVFIDPARRSGRGRTFDPRSYSPSFDFVTEVLTTNFAAAKLGPGIDHALVPTGVEAEWVSFNGGVKEAVLWSAGFAEGGITRRATVLPHGGQLTDADPTQAAIGGIGEYLYEPDGAVIRAGLVQQLAATLPTARRIDAHLAYLSADEPTATRLAKAYRVFDVVPYSIKRLRTELRRREVGAVEIKKRGVDIDPDALRRELKPAGPNSLTILLARVGQSRVAALAQPVHPS